MAGIFFKFSGDGNGNGEGILHQGDGVRSAKKPEVSKIAEAKIAPLIKEGDVVIEKKRDSVIETVTAENESKEKGENVLEEKFKTIFSKERIAGVKFESEKGELKSPGRQIQSAFWDNGALLQLMQGFLDEKKKQFEDPQTASDEEILQFCIDHLDDIKSTGNPENTKRAIRAVCEAQLNLQPTKEYGEVDENLRSEIDDLWHNQILAIHDELTSVNKADWDSGLYREEAKKFFNDETNKLNKLIEEINGNVTLQGDPAEYSEKSREFFKSVLEKIKKMQEEYEQNKLIYLKSDNEKKDENDAEKKRREVSEKLLGENKEHVDYLKRERKIDIESGGRFYPIGFGRFVKKELLGEQKNSLKKYIEEANDELKTYYETFTLQRVTENLRELMIIFKTLLDADSKSGYLKNKRVTNVYHELVDNYGKEFENALNDKKPDGDLINKIEEISHKVHDKFEEYNLEKNKIANSEMRGENSFERCHEVVEKEKHAFLETIKTATAIKNKKDFKIFFRNVYTIGLSDEEKNNLRIKIRNANEEISHAIDSRRENLLSQKEETKNENDEMKEFDELFARADEKLVRKERHETDSLELQEIADYDAKNVLAELLRFAKDHHVDSLSNDERDIWEKGLSMAKKIADENNTNEYVVIDGKTYRVIKKKNDEKEAQVEMEKFSEDIRASLEEYVREILQGIEQQFFGAGRMFPESTPENERRAFVSMCTRMTLQETIPELLLQYEIKAIDGTMLVEELLQKALTQK